MYLPLKLDQHGTCTKEKQQQAREFRVVIQNLQKQTQLASDLVAQYQPDILLAQEVNLSSESESFTEQAVAFTSRNGFGTAVYSADQNRLSSIHRVESPHSETGGFIRKKTIIATTQIGDHPVQFVSFHGYNGQPFKKVSFLVDHVRAVLEVIHEDNAVFAGDFNTWSQSHLNAIRVPLEEAGFRHALSWEYPDHLFLKGSLTVTESNIFPSKSDHLGSLLTLSIK